MIALGGAIGTGLIIGSGTALQRGGPLGLFLGYAYVGYVFTLIRSSISLYFYFRCTWFVLKTKGVK